MSNPALEGISDGSFLVHVCPFLVSRESRSFAEIVSWLPSEERKRADRFVKRADRRRFVLGRAMVRRLCGTHLGVKPEAVTLEQTANGKPYLDCSTEVGEKRFEFNVAHSGDCVLIAWTLGRSVGIDVEVLDRNPPGLFDDVAATAFSDPERAALSTAARDQVPATFYRIWVRKEAVLKAEGCGIGGRLKSFSVAHQDEARIDWVDHLQFPDSGRKWKIVDLAPAPSHLAALAIPEGAMVQIEAPDGDAFGSRQEP
jgi:4'-phosphopantetheinyl transferase